MIFTIQIYRSLGRLVYTLCEYIRFEACAVKHTSRCSHDERQTLERPELGGNFGKKVRKPHEMVHQSIMIDGRGSQNVGLFLENKQQIQKGIQPFGCILGVKDELIRRSGNQRNPERPCQKPVVDDEVFRLQDWVGRQGFRSSKMFHIVSCEECINAL